MSDKIPGTTENWENRTLGADEQYVLVASPESSDAVDAAMGIQRVTVRITKQLFDKIQSVSSERHMSHRWFIKRALAFIVNDEELLKKVLDDIAPLPDEEARKDKSE